MRFQPDSPSRRLLSSALTLLACFVLVTSVKAQDTVTGAFDGVVSNSQTGAPIAGAIVQFINQASEVPTARSTDANGRFYQGLLQPGTYIIRVSAPGFQTKELERRLVAIDINRVVPVPVRLDPAVAATTTTPTPPTVAAPEPSASPAATSKAAPIDEADQSLEAALNVTDARRGGTFTENEVSALPLGATTLVRTFDELALLLPGVASPPQTQGSVAGPGVGPGVGSAGQFAVNGLRSRANNFTVDGSDNNDEDIGVRRQGFFSLIPQPIESVKEFQVITLLAPAQFGRNIGAQVNAISKSGGNEFHGTIFGLFNSSQLNARNAFDRVGPNIRTQLTARTPAGATRNVFLDNNQVFTNLNTGAEDSFTLGQGGLVFGGPLSPNRMFFFLSVEGQLLNGTKEENFAVPTVAQRGFFGSGATGLTVDPFTGLATTDFPTAAQGDAFFSLFPFPNNPNGIYGENTFTQTLPESAQGKIASGKLDTNFKVRQRQQSFTARYNFTDDWRDIPVTGGALFSRLRPRVRTQNFSTFLNSEMSGPRSTRPIFNQLRLSYGRTRLNFDEGRDPGFLLPVQRRFNNQADAQFLLNAPLILNNTLPNATRVDYTSATQIPAFQLAQILFGLPAPTTEDALACRLLIGCENTGIGPIGQLRIAGFSPVGVDVFNFPQRRVNNTYQVADTLTMRVGGHHFAFGTDIRRTELNSALPRNSRPLVTFNGAPRLIFDQATTSFRFARPSTDANAFIRPEDFVAAAAPSGFFQSLATTDSDIHLRYYQLDFFGQDEWRIRPNLSLSYGLRYEYNTPPSERKNLIERTFNDAALNLVPGLRSFTAGRTQIFAPDKNNFAPRIGFAYSPNLFGRDKATVIRAGYGIFYDQILGAVVSQSRNVFPTVSTINFGGGCITNFGPNSCQNLFRQPLEFNVFNPLQTTFFVPGVGQVPIVQPGTLNTLNPLITLNNLVTTTNRFFGDIFGRGTTPFAATLPAARLDTPLAHHYAITFEQQITRNLVASAAYVGTQSRHLLRFTTPNLGQNLLLVPFVLNTQADPILGGPTVSGITLEPGSLDPSANVSTGRPTRGVGAVEVFDTTASSRYDALQLQLRGRFKLIGTTQFQVNYTYGKVTDDVSDVFDLAGASALPQTSNPPSEGFARERGPANFDVRHRFSYSYVTTLPELRKRSAFVRFLFGGLQFAGTGIFQTAQPFTVNSLFDINLDGNLTDRLNTTTGIQQTGDRAQPLRLAPGTNLSSLLAPVGRDGDVGRNTFRASNLLLGNTALIKNFAINERQSLTFRMEIFNVLNRANYGIPVRFLEAPGFGRATDTVTPGRRIQFVLKFNF